LTQDRYHRDAFEGLFSQLGETGKMIDDPYVIMSG
jgi:hypothetical protein